MIVTFSNQTNRLVRISQEEIADIPSSEVDNPDQSETIGEELNQDRSMKEYMYPTRTSQHSCIILPADAGQFELKTSTIHMFPMFKWVDAENPFHHKLNGKRFASLELKLGQICDALNERKKGKLPSQPQQIQKSAFQSNEFKSYSQLHKTPQKTPSVENESEQESDSKNSTNVNDSLTYSVHVASFPQRLVQQKGGNQYNEILEMFKLVNINIPFLEAISQTPTYAKFLKDLCTQKRKLHVHKRGFLTEQLGLGEMKPTLVTLQLEDRSIKIPRGIVEDMLIKVDKFFFPVDFIVLDTQHVQNPYNHVPVILGHSFLATSNAIMNCRHGVLKLSFGNMTVELNVFNISQQPIDCDDGELHEINMIESLIQDSLPDILSVDPLQAFLDNFDLDLFDFEYISEVHSLLESVPPMDIVK
ncbi:uncharacterized protein LOC113351376 [Papaver somniferum]|uniref:uncharacterized protein LOC113351376 n=1 Tax=Papaver somniferum TaxID=3469 RepID=UPI000E6F90D9|nr:uncharacterized protein LOC113351376 [Papaver somniferum]